MFKIVTVSCNTAENDVALAFHIDPLPHKQLDNLTRDYLRINRPANRPSYV